MAQAGRIEFASASHIQANNTARNGKAQHQANSTAHQPWKYEYLPCCCQQDVARQRNTDVVAGPAVWARRGFTSRHHHHNNIITTTVHHHYHGGITSSPHRHNFHAPRTLCTTTALLGHDACLHGVAGLAASNMHPLLLLVAPRLLGVNGSTEELYRAIRTPMLTVTSAWAMACLLNGTPRRRCCPRSMSALLCMFAARVCVAVRGRATLLATINEGT